ncbi:hypothetical protein P4056_08630 [Pseudomonas aeruginosa]|nr:hypothetical protein [Pseudomonas aeruginosa]
MRAYGAVIDVEEFYRLYWERAQGSGAKIPKGMDHAFLSAMSGREAEIARLIAEWNATVVSDSERSCSPRRSVWPMQSANWP